jgi:hypothetical protein
MMCRVQTLGLALLLALHAAACGSDDEESALNDRERSSDAAPMLQACDPLKGEERPITLGKVIAIGRDGGGVLYVLVQPDEGDYQVFVSEHGVLQRHRVLGSGSGDSMWITVSVEAAPQFGLYVKLDTNGDATSMRRFDPADVVDKSQQPDGEDLDVLDESAIDDLELRNLAPGVAIEYLGTLEDGRRVLVVHPTDDYGYEDFRVFLGTPKKMLEREVKNVSRSKSGPTFIELTLDDKPATLDFEITWLGDHVEYGNSTLETDGDTLSITLEHDPDATAADGLKFFCR